MNIRIAMIAAALMLSTLTGRASAAFFDEFKMVGSNTSKVLQSSFNLAETPYLYYKLSPNTVGSKVFSFWLSPLSNTSLATEITSIAPDIDAPFDPVSQGWVSLANWGSIPDSEKIGNWNITGYLKTGSIYADCVTTSFTVTPEPMSMILYGIGGLPIAATLFRRRKIAA